METNIKSYPNLIEAPGKHRAVPIGRWYPADHNEIIELFLMATLNDTKSAIQTAVKINEPATGLALHAPFGGLKQSSANTFKEQE